MKKFFSKIAQRAFALAISIMVVTNTFAQGAAGIDAASSELATYMDPFLSIVMRPSRKAMQVFNEEKNKRQISIDSRLQKKQIGVGDLLEVIKMQNEINELRKNGKLTPEDTLRIKDLYNKLNK